MVKDQGGVNPTVARVMHLLQKLFTGLKLHVNESKSAVGLA